MMKKNIVALCAMHLFGYLAYSRNLWFPDLEEQIAIGKDVLSKSIDIENTGKVLWRIPREQWKYTGEVKVALRLDYCFGSA